VSPWRRSAGRQCGSESVNDDAETPQLFGPEDVAHRQPLLFRASLPKSFRQYYCQTVVRNGEARHKTFASTPIDSASCPPTVLGRESSTLRDLSLLSLETLHPKP